MNDKIKVIVCDVDKTLYDGFSWDNILINLGFEEENRILFKEYYPQKDKTKEWSEKQAALIKGKSVSELKSKIFPLKYMPGVKEFFSDIGNKYTKIILTTGIDIVADEIKKELCFDFSYSNRLTYQNGIFDGICTYLIPLWEKDKKLKEILRNHNFSLEEACFIGDGFNDIPCFRIAKLPIAVKNPWTMQVEEAVKQNNGYIITDFKELKDIL